MNDWLTDIYNLGDQQSAKEAVCTVCNQKAAAGVNIDPFPVCRHQCNVDTRRSLKIFIAPQNRHDALGEQVWKEEMVQDSPMPDSSLQYRLLVQLAKKEARRAL